MKNTKSKSPSKPRSRKTVVAVAEDRFQRYPLPLKNGVQHDHIKGLSPVNVEARLPVKITLTLSGVVIEKFRKVQAKFKTESGISVSDASLAASLIEKSLV